jgi:predicted nucleotidyltransferase
VALDATELLKRELARRPEIVAAWLFGSTVSRGFERAGDVDVAVQLDASVPRDKYLDYRLEMMGVLEPALRKPVDFIVFNEAPVFLRFEIVRGGVVILNRDPMLVVDLKARAMIEWWDWKPTFERICRESIARLRAMAHG